MSNLTSCVCLEFIDYDVNSVVEDIQRMVENDNGGDAFLNK